MKIPSTTVELLDSLKALRGFSSDYQLWKYLGWKQTTMSNYRTRGSAMSGAHAIRIADELGLPRAYVLACMEAERERNDQVAKVWRELAHKLKGAAAIILIALGLSALHPNTAKAGVLAPLGGSAATADIYSVKSRRRRRGALGRLISSALEALAACFPVAVLS